MRKYLEPLCWAVSLVVLGITDFSTDSFSFCLFKLVGFETCWGCGIGHAMQQALHLQLAESFRLHPAGIPATIILLYHTATSFYHLRKSNKHGPATNAYDAA